VRKDKKVFSQSRFYHRLLIRKRKKVYINAKSPKSLQTHAQGEARLRIIATERRSQEKYRVERAKKHSKLKLIVLGGQL
jgi:hypothetical protein